MVATSPAEVEVAYDCPHCRAPLRARMRPHDDWVRCPACGRGGLPPRALLVEPPPSLAAEGPKVRDDLVFLDDAPVDPYVAPAVPPVFSLDPPPTVSPVRLILATLLFVSLVLLLFCYLDGSTLGTGLFSALAGVFVILLAATSRGRAEEY